MNTAATPGLVPTDEAALATALAQFPAASTVVLDFDGTLLHRNSTHLYLRSLRPQFVAKGLLSLMEAVQPWRLLPGADKRWVYRDWIRVVVLSVLLPWSAVLWRRQAPGLARRYANTALLASLTTTPDRRFVVATYGFRFLVAPLLRAMPSPVSSKPWTLGVSARFLSAFRLRRVGKAEAVRRYLGADAMAGSVLITDSDDDRDFVPLSHTVFLITPDTDAHEPMTGIRYLPLQYMQNCKRQGENTIVRVILFYDLVALFLAYAPASLRPIATMAGLVFFQLAFWTIYELGNWENDVLGDLYENKPHIPKVFAEWRSRVRPVQAWIWAAGLCVVASLLLGTGLDGDVSRFSLTGELAYPALVAAVFAFLLVYLVVSRVMYALYNRTDPKTRVFLYPLLQLSKATGLVLILPASPAGLLLLVSIVLARQLRYAVYRYGETRKAFSVPLYLHTLLCYVLLDAVSLCLTGPQGPVFWAISAFVVLWHLQRSRRDIMTALREIVWLPSQHRAGSAEADVPVQP